MVTGAKSIQLSDSKLCDKLNDWIIYKVDEQTNWNKRTEEIEKTTTVIILGKKLNQRGTQRREEEKNESISELKRRRDSFKRTVPVFVRMCDRKIVRVGEKERLRAQERVKK